ncbi:MAG: hypothetical protein M1480_21300 [Bacteroidetes bacterium]|nr:hypothetical protein [Bacteroidota bacterium]
MPFKKLPNEFWPDFFSAISIEITAITKFIVVKMEARRIENNSSYDMIEK